MFKSQNIQLKNVELMRESMMEITMARGWELNGSGGGWLKVTESN